MPTRVETCRRAAEMDLGRAGAGSEPLSEDRLNELAEHVEHCAACRTWLEENAGLGGLGMLAEDVREAVRLRDQSPVNVATPVDRLNELLQSEGKGAGGKGGFRVEAEIGRGGMGVVYRAFQPDLKRHVALKVLPALLCAVRPDAMARFRREAALAAGLKHSNIIGVYDFGEIGGTLYYAMELVEGRSLRDLIQEMRAIGIGGTGDRADKSGLESALSIVTAATDQSPAPSASGAGSRSAGGGATRAARGQAYFTRVAGWIADVAEALHYAHDHGVIHRDIKPANLMLSRAGRLMICDFGLARSVIAGDGAGAGGDPRSLTMTRALIGTSRYMSPESVDETIGPVDRRSDVYALGATFYELLTLKPLFAAEDDREILNRVLSTEPAPPRSLVRQVPAELEVICLKALAKRPKERYESAQAFADDLRRWMLGTPIHARRPSIAVRVGNFVRRRKAATILTLVLALSLAAGSVVAVKAWRESRRAEESEIQLRSSTLELLKNQAAAAAADYRFTDALTLLDRAITLSPDSLGLKRERGYVLHWLRRPAEAAEVLEAVVAIKPDDWRAHYTLVEVYRDWKGAPAGKLAEHVEALNRGKPETVDALYARSLIEKDDRAAIALLDKAYALDASRFDVLAQRARRHAALKNYEAALADVERQIAISPRVWAPYFNRGMALQNLQRLPEAEAAFTKALEVESGNSWIWTARAEVRVELGKLTEAIEDANRAMAIDEKDNRAYMARGKARLGLGDLDAARSDFDQAIELDPRDASAYIKRSLLAAKQGQLNQVISDAGRAIELDPTSFDGYNNRLTGYYRLGQYERALADADALVRLKPNSAEPHRKRSAVLHKLGRWPDLEECTSRVIALDGRVATDFKERGWVRLALGRAPDAAADFTRAVELDLTKEGWRIGRAHAYALMRQWPLAHSDFAALESATEDGAAPTGRLTLLRGVTLMEAGKTGEGKGVLADLERSATDPWIQTLAQAMLGKVSDLELLGAAVGDKERTEAHFYIGMGRVIAGETEGAKAAFAECVASDKTEDMVALVARGRLKMMEMQAK